MKRDSMRVDVLASQVKATYFPLRCRLPFRYVLCCLGPEITRQILL